MAEQKMVHQSQYKGWLYKWTNYLKGYQKRWFVLQNGLLSYYRTQAEMAHTCRGTINLANAFIHTEDSCTIVISNAGTQTFYLKATSEVERQRWVTALELAKADAIRMMEPEDSDEDNPQPDKNELQNTLRTLGSKLEDLNTCNDLIGKHGAGLQKALSEVEQLDSTQDVASKVKIVNERATMFRITSNAMINACSEFLELAQSQGKRWQRMLSHEHEQRLKLEEMVEQLAKEQVSLETQARRSMHASVGHHHRDNPGSDEDDFEFFDALPYPVDEIRIALPHHTDKKLHRRTESDMSINSDLIVSEKLDSDESDIDEQDGDNPTEARVYSEKSKADSPRRSKDGKGHRRVDSRDGIRGNRSSASESSLSDTAVSLVPKKKRRSAIREKPNYSLNLWSIMKNCIGKDLSKIPMPVNFNEPTSMLQRITEEYEYSECLDRGARCDDPAEQIAHVAAFSVSAYASTTNRTTKPFNPLLGETYECDRTDDYGWWSLAEQVSHHPPTAALHTEGKDWVLWQEFTMGSKFRGKYLQIIPTGIVHLEYKSSGNHYTWKKVYTTVHNIIVGRLWVDNHGEMDIINHKNGDKCHLKYSAYSYFSRDIPRRVTGVVTSNAGKAEWVLTGTWDSQLELAKVTHVDETSKGKPVFETGPHRVIWKRRYSSAGRDKMYNFTDLTIQLNEPEEGVAPTDSRNRPDQRAMENGEWDKANRLKLLVEEKQRTTRRRREAEAEEAAKRGEEYPVYKAVWFEKSTDSITGNVIHKFNGKYWDHRKRQDWSVCPDIYIRPTE